MMLTLLFLLIVTSNLGLAKTAQEKGLPYEPDTTEIRINKIPNGKQMTLEFDLQLPSTQGLNKGAPSFIGIYEKEKNSNWRETVRLSLNDQFAFLDQIHFLKTIGLRSDSSEIAVFSTIYHCGKDHKTACYIQGFKGKTNRSPKAKSDKLAFYIQGTMR